MMAEYDTRSLEIINYQRKFLKENHPDLFNKGLELEEKYGHYNFIVLDLPVFKLMIQNYLKKFGKIFMDYVHDNVKILPVLTLLMILHVLEI